jgi:hypothetical protein
VTRSRAQLGVCPLVLAACFALSCGCSLARAVSPSYPLLGSDTEHDPGEPPANEALPDPDPRESPAVDHGEGVIVTAPDVFTIADITPALQQPRGVRFVCTTGAESKYSIDTSPFNMPTLNPVDTRIINEYVRDGGIGGSIGGSWERRARLTLGVGEDSDGRAVERSLRRHARMFEACYEQRVAAPSKTTLRLDLSFDERRELSDATLRSGTLGSADADGCIAAVLRQVDWQGLANGPTTIAVELRLRMR